MSYVRCPCCGQIIELRPYVEHQARVYQKTVIATTQCCGRLVVVEPVTSLVVTEYHGPRKDDDWLEKAVHQPKEEE